MNIENIKQIEKATSNSFYHFKEQVLRDNISSFKAAFSTHYSNVGLGYSYKTNYLPAACKVGDEEGLYAEIVSPMELEIVKKLSIEPQKIIYNGPIKDVEGIKLCLENNGKVNIDNLNDLSIILETANANLTKEYNVGIRLNLPVHENEFSRFGIDPHSDEFEIILNSVRKQQNLSFVGIHFHTTSPDKSVESYLTRLQMIYDICIEFDLLNELEYLDLGGGFYGPMDNNIKSQFNDYIPSYNDYGVAVSGLMKELFPEENVELILEPGLALTVNILDFYTKVMSVKNLRGVKVINTSGSFYNVKPSGHKKDLTFHLIKNSDIEKRGIDTNAKIAGFTCLENDYLFDSYSGESIIQNDYLKFDNVGAYTIVFKPPFIKLSPPIITYNNDDKQIAQVRHEESFNDIFKAYEF